MGNTELPSRGGSTGAALAGNTEMFPQNAEGMPLEGESSKGNAEVLQRGWWGRSPEAP